MAGTASPATGMAEFMLRECPMTCRTCSHADLIGGLAECKDSHEQCNNWAASGECDANRRFMLSGCSKACDVCAPKKHGCERRNAVPGVYAPGGLYSMFERALTAFPQYTPIALSKPTEESPSAPYVLQFENILNEEEAQAMIARAGDKLERSLAGDQVSPVRTSTQFWCDDSDGCTSDETVLKITERMMNVTNLPVNNAEYFQILRYEPCVCLPRASVPFLLPLPHTLTAALVVFHTQWPILQGAPRPADRPLDATGRARLHLPRLPLGR